MLELVEYEIENLPK